MERDRSVRPLYVMLIGLPASGKTTLCRDIQTAYPDKNWHVVSTDDYLEAKAAQRGVTYNEVFQELIDDATKDINADRAAALAAGRNILHDQTNLTAKSRGKKMSSVPKTYCTTGLMVKAPPEERASRLVSRLGKVISPDVDQKMAASFEEPSAKEFDVLIGSDFIEALRYYF